jgi:hypothetical protein
MLSDPLAGFLAVNHPRDAEPIDEHTKSDGPKCLLEGICTVPFPAKALNMRFRLARILEAYYHGEALWFLVVLRRNVSTG